MRLLGKVAVVTGAAAGLGRAVALRFAREGAFVVAADTNVPNGKSLLKQIYGLDLNGMFVQTDVSDESQVKRLFNMVLTQHGQIDVLYNNAAILPFERDAQVHELSVETWDCIMAINLRGSFLCSKYAVPSMLKQKRGSIIHVSSPTGIYGCAPNLTAYSTSKAGLLGLTRAMAAAHARDGIRVNSIVPGTMDTPMNGYVLSDDTLREKLMEAIPLGRLGLPEDVEGLAVFLASDESAYCTGGIHMCDGGLTAV
jgi:NAD(P)-dependent dehydrogenase (short-subunit alcohol dehydrogenase family)